MKDTKRRRSILTFEVEGSHADRGPLFRFILRLWSRIRG